LQALWEAQLAAVAAVGGALAAIEAAVAACLPRLRGGGRLVYVGAGTSGRLAALDAAELVPTFGLPPARIVTIMAGGAAAFTQAVEGAEDDAAAARAAVAAHRVGAEDVMIAVAASGRTEFTCVCLEEAGRRGALTIALANNQGVRLLDAAAHRLLVPTGAEAIAGSTRLKAGTAQKIVLNLFSTLLMVRLGHTYRGAMVDMHASNTKLRARARRMLCDLAGVDATQAEAALARADGHVKTALVVLKGLDAPAARALLDRHGGDVRAALQALAAAQ